MKAHHLLEVLSMPQDMDKSPNPWLFSVKDSEGKIHILCRDEIKKALKEQTITPEGAEFLRTCKLHKEYLTTEQIEAIQGETAKKVFTTEQPTK